MIDKDLQDFAQYHHSYVGGYIQLADTKAGAVFAVMAGLLGFLLSKEPFRDSLSLACSIDTAIAWVCFILLVLTSVIAVAVIIPRGFRSQPGPIYFRSVAEYGSAGDYLTALRAISSSDLADAMTRQSYDLSVVCSRKYSWLLWAMRFGFAAVAGVGFAIWHFSL